MIILPVVGALFIFFGVATLFFPGAIRSLDRMDNRMRGRQPDQGGAYYAGRVFRGVMLIGAGVLLLLVPVWIISGS